MKTYIQINTQAVVHKKLPILSAEHPAEALLLRAMIGLLAASVCLYLYFVSASAFNVIARAEAQRRSAALEGSIGVLQQRYFELSRAITQDEAAREGLTPVAATAYVHRPGAFGLAR